MKQFMGFFDLFKKKIKDADMCILRDLLVVGFTNDGPTLQSKTRDILAEMATSMYIGPDKLMKALSIDPDTIADVYPSDYEEKKKHLFNLLYVWKFSGNYQRKASLLYIKTVCKKMNLSSTDYNNVYNMVKILDPLD